MKIIKTLLVLFIISLLFVGCSVQYVDLDEVFDHDENGLVSFPLDGETAKYLINWESFEIEYDGAKFNLPIPFDEFSETTGLVVPPNDDTVVFSQDTMVTSVFLKDTNFEAGELAFQRVCDIYIKNETDKDTTLSGCTVLGVQVTSDACSDDALEARYELLFPGGACSRSEVSLQDAMIWFDSSKLSEKSTDDILLYENENGAYYKLKFAKDGDLDYISDVVLCCDAI